MSLFETPFFSNNDAALDEIIQIHRECERDFLPMLSSRVNIDDYCLKLYKNAEIITCRHDDKVVGITAIYCNNFNTKTAFISSVCLLSDYRGKGLSSKMLQLAIQLAKEKKMKAIKLEVGIQNHPAIVLYEKHGFKTIEIKEQTMIMELVIYNTPLNSDHKLN